MLFRCQHLNQGDSRSQIISRQEALSLGEDLAVICYILSTGPPQHRMLFRCQDLKQGYSHSQITSHQEARSLGEKLAVMGYIEPTGPPLCGTRQTHPDKAWAKASPSMPVGARRRLD
ncbi:hypothetical protein NDU88_002625 [Pleurodeles waltl]|uniref:Uncharacterized protein n=1 Tax=Pleurodeles waltl TaxID=8319 RepID=A0AAV7PAJ4_PLEWA|nr:hypothetical protein NDU88_002625 [Pleurodeles waltl]